MATAGKGIDFSATANSSGTMTSELLDWYEEGTFSPLLYDQAGNAAPSMGTTLGRYTRIGNRVLFMLLIQANSVSGMNGSAQVFIHGLPFTSVNVSYCEAIIVFGAAQGFNTSMFNAGESIVGRVGQNSSKIYVSQWAYATGTDYFSIDELSSDGRLKCSGQYEVA